MDEFDLQKRSTLIKDISEFNTNPQFEKIRNLYKNNFELIYNFINKYGVKPSIENISKIDKKLSNDILVNILFLTRINRAILEQEFTFKNIK